MARAKYQVLVLPFLRTGDERKYCVFKRRDMGIWQFVSGGGEETDESVLYSARREAFEEAGISYERNCFPLETRASLPSYLFPFATAIWGRDLLVVPEYAFAVETPDERVILSDEHTEYRWVSYDEAMQLLYFDSNKTALWELDSKLKFGSVI